MFRKLRKLLTPEDQKKQKSEKKSSDNQSDSEDLEKPFSSSLESNVAFMKELFGSSSDLVMREFRFGVHQEIKVALFFIDGLVDKISISEAILKPFVYRSLSDDQGPLLPEKAYPLIRDWLITFASVKEANEIGQVVNFVMAGFAALFIDGSSQTLAIEVKGWSARAVEEPKSEAFVRGPRDGFNETLRTNTSLVRRRIRSPKLRFDLLNIGRLTKTDVCVVYIDGIVNPALKDEVMSRLQGIDTDSILESGYIEDFIKDNPWTPFTLMDRTERPDKLAAGLLEGKVAIMVDNTPFALLAPAVFSEFMQSPEDYYEGNNYFRPLRWLALITSSSLTAFYVALVTFHQEMIPSSLALSIATGREGVPFPTMVEALLMELAFDFLREAGTRMPLLLGQAVGIVGALVLGQAAVAAGIFSPGMVIIVSLGAVTSFMIPNYSSSSAIRVIRYFLILIAGCFGLPGLFWGFLVLLLHMASLRSFGVPYLYPLAPSVPGEWGDVFIRNPLWKMDLRPLLFRTKNRRRQAPGQQPKPPAVRPEPNETDNRANTKDQSRQDPGNHQNGTGDSR
jgi:spore germination protein KA